MKVDRVPEDGGLPDALRAIGQLHICLDDEKKKAAKHRAATARKLTEIKSEQTRLLNALGANPRAKGHRPKVATMTTFQAGWRIATATGSGLAAAFVLYRIAVALWPGLWAGLKALNAAVLAAKI